MRLRTTLATLSVWLVAVSFLGLGGTRVQAGPMTVEVQLLWGTDAAKSPNPAHKPVEPDVKKKLDELPLKWPNWFEVNQKKFKLARGDAKKEPLSEKCAIEVKNLGEANVEVGLYGKGNQVVRRILKLPKGEPVVFVGGKAPNATAWLVVLKRLE